MRNFFKSVGIFLAALVFIAVVINNFYNDLVDPYLWDKRIIKQWQDQGWRLISTTEQPSLMFPWTFIWRPTGRITFVHDDMVSRHFRTDGKPGGLVSGVVARFIRDHERGRIEASRHVEAFNCSTGQFSIMGDVDTKKKFDVFAADGSPLPGMWYPMPKDIAAYFCKT